MTPKEYKRKQRLFDTAVPANCRDCGALIAFAPSKNGVLCKYDLDEQQRPTFAHHICKPKKTGTNQDVP